MQSWQIPYYQSNREQLMVVDTHSSSHSLFIHTFRFLLINLPSCAEEVCFYTSHQIPQEPIMPLWNKSHSAVSEHTLLYMGLLYMFLTPFLHRLDVCQEKSSNMLLSII